MGVSWTDAQGGKWRAVLNFKRRAYELGFYGFENSVATAVDKKYIQLAGDFVDPDRLNFRGKLNEYRRQIKVTFTLVLFE